MVDKKQKKKDSKLSIVAAVMALFTFTIPYIDNILEHILRWDKQTPFALPVVPDVNNKTRNSSWLTFILSKSTQPLL